MHALTESDGIGFSTVSRRTASRRRRRRQLLGRVELRTLTNITPVSQHLQFSCTCTIYEYIYNGLNRTPEYKLYRINVYYVGSRQFNENRNRSNT